MMKLVTSLWVFIPFILFSQSGELVQADGSRFSVQMLSKNQLEIKGSKNPSVDTFLRTLLFSRVSRKYLQHLITSASEIKVNVSDKTGIMLLDGKYGLIAGLTGPENDTSIHLIQERSNLRSGRKKRNLIYSKNTLELYCGSITYFYNPAMTLDSTNTILFDFDRNIRISSFSMDTINIEPVKHSDLMYQNRKELYYFAGTHEIVHTTPGNINLQLAKKDSEKDAMLIERKLFRKRKEWNKKGSAR